MQHINLLFSDTAIYSTILFQTHLCHLKGCAISTGTAPYRCFVDVLLLHPLHYSNERHPAITHILYIYQIMWALFPHWLNVNIYSDCLIWYWVIVAHIQPSQARKFGSLHIHIHFYYLNCFLHIQQQKGTWAKKSIRTLHCVEGPHRPATQCSVHNTALLISMPNVDIFTRSFIMMWNHRSLLSICQWSPPFTDKTCGYAMLTSTDEGENK